MVEEDGGYFFKFDNDQFYLKSFYNFRTRKYTIKFVGLYIPILQFKNLDPTEYHEMLQMLKEIHAVTDVCIKETEDLDLDQHQGKIASRYAYMGLASGFAFMFGFFLPVDSPLIIRICNILNLINFIGNALMISLVNILGDSFEKMRKLYISQYIEAIFVVLDILIVFAFLSRLY